MVAAPLEGSRVRYGGGLGELLGAAGVDGDGREDGTVRGAGVCGGALLIKPAWAGLRDALATGAAVGAPAPTGVPALLLPAGPATGSGLACGRPKNAIAPNASRPTAHTTTTASHHRPARPVPLIPPGFTVSPSARRA